MSILFEANKTPLNAENLNKLISTTEQSLTDSQKQQARTNIGIGNVVNGAKGSSENTYRTGNINITPANVGAADINHLAATESAIKQINERIDTILAKNSNIVEDLVIKTQQKFDALIADPTWFDVESVTFDGEFTTNGGIKIPQTVKQIQGLNNAKIIVTNFICRDDKPAAAGGGLWYEELPSDSDYYIRDLAVECRAGFSGVAGIAFSNCINLTNCTGIGYSGFFSGFFAAGFESCKNLTNCIGNGISYGNNGSFGVGFDNCSELMDCVGTGSGGEESVFDFGIGFNECGQLTNCVGTGFGYQGYGFYNTSCASYCKSDPDNPSTTAIWGGKNTDRDDDTCELD